MTLFRDLYSWLARIHFGQWDNLGSWRKAVEKKSLCWLQCPPTISLPSINGRILKKRATSSVQSWQTAGLVMGLDSEQVIKYAKKHIDRLTQCEDVEAALLAYAFKQKGILSLEAETLIRNRFAVYLDSGTIPYRSSHKDIRYVDTIGMICPFLYSSGMEALADRQLDEYDQALYNGIFPFHAFSLSTHLPMGVCDWSRGVGWYILGIIESGKQEVRILKLAEEMLSLQHPNGSFGCFLFNSGSRPESSGTALAGLLFVRAYQICKDPRFIIAAKKTELSLMRMTRRDGSVDYSQGDTEGIGTYSRLFGILPFTQGMTLLLSKRLDDCLERTVE